MLDDAAVRAADRAARVWKAAEIGPIVPGSEAHRTAFCRMLLDTHNPYKPAIIDWPILEPEARDARVDDLEAVPDISPLTRHLRPPTLGTGEAFGNHRPV